LSKEKRVEEQRALIAEWEREDYRADRLREARQLLKTMTNILDEMEANENARATTEMTTSVRNSRHVVHYL
jgi:hypothetical protein